MKYEYHDLSDDQFEDLVVGICKEILGVGVQPFAKGPDGGIDARFEGTAQSYPSTSKPWSGIMIIQAKHTTGYNKKFSDNDFFKTNSSIIYKEIPKIKTLFENKMLNYYMLFSNRKLPAGVDVKLKSFISDNTGIDKSKIGLFDIDMMDSILKKYSWITERLNFNVLDMPIKIIPDDLADVIIKMSGFIDPKKKEQKNLFYEINRTTFEKKNKINKLSKTYARTIKKSMIYFGEIKEFLESPENEFYLELYNESIVELQMNIAPYIEDHHSYDLVLNFFYHYLIERDSDLRRNKRILRTLLHYMYYFCDLGDSYEADAK